MYIQLYTHIHAFICVCAHMFYLHLLSAVCIYSIDTYTYIFAFECFQRCPLPNLQCTSSLNGRNGSARECFQKLSGATRRGHLPCWKSLQSTRSSFGSKSSGSLITTALSASVHPCRHAVSQLTGRLYTGALWVPLSPPRLRQAFSQSKLATSLRNVAIDCRLWGSR